MSRVHLEALDRAKAFKPAPSLWELAQAHVPFADLGLADPPEARLVGALAEGDGLALVTGAPGSGKSSVLAHVAARMASQPGEAPGRPYLPLFVPVAANPAAADDLRAFGQAATLEAVLALRDGLMPEHRRRFEELAASARTRQRTGARFNAKLAAKVLGAGGEAGLALGGDLLTLVDDAPADNHGGLRTLGDVVRARGFEPLLLVEDTDAWVAAPNGADVAAGFFTRILRPLASEVEVGVAVAVQTGWTGSDGFRAARERAVAVIPVPEPTGGAATLALTRVLERRIDRAGLDPNPAVGDVFAPSAIEVVATRLVAAGFRSALALVRDTFDRHADGFPERFERVHVLEAQ